MTATFDAAGVRGARRGCHVFTVHKELTVYGTITSRGQLMFERAFAAAMLAWLGCYIAALLSYVALECANGS